MLVNKRKMLDGNSAIVEAIRLARVQVIAAYPITPQSPIIEKLSSLVENKEIRAEFIRAESEHSALSAVIGAQLTGVRAATATSSVGLALMHEVLGVAAGCRIPTIMPVINRALVSPWSLWCDHQDTMAERDSGWIQLYAENVQESFDLMLQAYTIAEHEDVLLPIMVCLDGFFVSHSLQPITLPDQITVDEFLGTYNHKSLMLDPKRPVFINNLTPPEDFSELRYQQEKAFSNALEVMLEVQRRFCNIFCRKYGLVEDYHCVDSEVILVGIGSLTGTIKYVIDKLRENKNIKIGLLKITCFRPFPCNLVKEILKNKKSIGVIDRTAGLGAQGGPLYLEVKSALNKEFDRISNFIIGLGGRDITEETIENIVNVLMNSMSRCGNAEKIWTDTQM
jgi:pyruvate ferredoxin oxidoreductase alpha subunit